MRFEFIWLTVRFVFYLFNSIFFSIMAWSIALLPISPSSSEFQSGSDKIICCVSFFGSLRPSKSYLNIRSIRQINFKFREGLGPKENNFIDRIVALSRQLVDLDVLRLNTLLTKQNLSNNIKIKVNNIANM